MKVISKKINLKNSEFLAPPYTKVLMNSANQNSQATRPKNVGKLSEMFPEFQKEYKKEGTVLEWKKWYSERQTEAFEIATNKIFEMIEKYRKAIEYIDKELIRNWVENLIVDKTYFGLNAQYIIIKEIAEILNVDFRYATPEEESKNIDGFLNGKPVQIKSEKFNNSDPFLKIQKIDCPIILYKKEKDEIRFAFDESDFI